MVFPNLVRDLLVDSRINPMFLMTVDFKRSTEEFLVAERRRTEIF